MSTEALAGARCADLPPEWVDKYFHANLVTDRVYGRIALGICTQCPVVEDCRLRALKEPDSKQTGIVGGTTYSEIRHAKAWRSYELGSRATLPDYPRPEWLPQNEMTDAAEAARIESDPDEAWRFTA